MILNLYASDSPFRIEQFTNQKGHNPEEPFVNLDEGVLFTNN